MKIPETSANIGAYYGNEDNGQWQPNGVIIDNGVGGGVVGSGDAGVHRPPVYPVHIQRGHIPGYVMAEAYYPAAVFPLAPPAHAAAPDDFADYMWMENEEEFDKQVMQQLEEEALMEQCIEAMLEDEQRERRRPVHNGHTHYPTTSNGQPSCSLEEAVSKSTLNPLAAEFVPTRVIPAPQSEEKTENSTEEKPTEETSPKEEVPEIEVESKDIVEEKIEVKSPETSPEPIDTPEVSAADVQPIEKKKDVKKIEQKKVVKQEVKVKVKAVAVKSETRVQKKKEVKCVKSETGVEEKVEDVEISKQSPPPITEEVSGIKPINYAAAAKANKPKKSTTPPITEKIVKEKPKTIEKEKTEKKEKTQIKDIKPKTEKTTVQRKNSTK